MFPRSRQLFRFIVKYDFDRKFTLGASWRVMIRSSRRRHGRNRGGGTLSRPLKHPARWVHQKGSIRWSPIPRFVRVGTRWSLRDCGYWQWQQAPREAWLGTARTEDSDLLTRTRADSRSKKRSETGTLSVGDKIVAWRQKLRLAGVIDFLNYASYFKRTDLPASRI